MAIELKQGLGKDGSPTIPYVRAHPTNYVWRDDIERLTRGLVNRVYDALFNDPDPPDIWWIIWQGEIWNRFYKRPRRRHFPGGAGAADMGHFNHIHVTYLDAEDQK